MHPRAPRCSSTWRPRSSLACRTPCCQGGCGCWAGSAPHRPHAGQGCGHSRHLCLRAGDSWLPDLLKLLLQNNHHHHLLLLPAASWLNILRVYRNSRLTHNSPAGCSCRERSRQFLPSLTQPKAPARLCLRWGAGSGTPVGGGWEHPLLFPLGWWSSHAPLPQPQIYSCFSSPMGKGCSLLVPDCFLALLVGQVVCWRGLVWG